MLATLAAKTERVEQMVRSWGRRKKKTKKVEVVVRPACKLLFFRSPLLRLRWHRVILDEVQEVAWKSPPNAHTEVKYNLKKEAARLQKNRRRELGMQLYTTPRLEKDWVDDMMEVYARIPRANSWCISGTPLENSAGVECWDVHARMRATRRLWFCHAVFSCTRFTPCRTVWRAMAHQT